MLKSKLQILPGIVVLFPLVLFVGHGFAATVDGLNLSGFAGPTVCSAPHADFDGLWTTAVPAERNQADVFSNADSNMLIGHATATATALTGGLDKRAALGPEVGVIYAFAFASDDRISGRRDDTASGIDTAGWQLLLSAMPHASLRQRFDARFSPTFLMFVAGLVGLIFLARGRPRRRGQLGLMT